MAISKNNFWKIRGLRDPENYLVELIENQYNIGQTKRLYNLLNKAVHLVQHCLEHKENNTFCKHTFDDNDIYCQTLLYGFEQECQWAKKWVREKVGKFPNVPATDILRDLPDYISRMYSWIESAVKSENPDSIEYEQLKNLWDGFWERLINFYDRVAHYNKPPNDDKIKPKLPKITPKMSKQARVLAVLKDHPDWTNREIAEAAGVHPKSLSRMEAFCKARAILKTGKSNNPNGSKDAETGDIEAWEK